MFGITEMVESSGGFFDTLKEAWNEHSGTIIGVGVTIAAIGTGAYCICNQSERIDKIEKDNKDLRSDLSSLGRSTAQTNAITRAVAEAQGLNVDEIIKASKKKKNKKTKDEDEEDDED